MHARLPHRWLLALAALVVVLNLNTLPGALLSWDDSLYVTENRRIQLTTLADLPRVWSPADALSGGFVEFFPLRDSVYALLYLAFGLSPWPYHLVQVLLHAAMCVAVARLLDRWLGPIGALAGGLYFATQPMHVESVAWISALKDPMSGLCIVGALLLWGRWRDQGSRAAWLGALVAMAAACLVKSFGILVPGMLVLVDWAWERRPLDRLAILDKLPFVALAVAALALYLRIGAANGVTDLPPPGGTAWTGLLTMSWVYVSYLGKLLVPVGMSARYVIHPVMGMGDPRVLVTIAVLAATWLPALLLVRQTRVPLFVNAWVLFCLLLVLRIVQIPIEMADRYVYLPSIGFAVAVGWVARTTWDRWRTGTVAVLALGTVAYAATTETRNLVWRDDEALWSSVAARSPEFPGAWTALGQYYVRQRRYDEAAAVLDRALALDPRHTSALTTRGTLRRSRGDLAGAVTDFRAAIVADPVDPKPRSNLAGTLVDLQRYDDAERVARRALLLDPAYPTAWTNLGMACAGRDDRPCATDAFVQAMRLSPHDRDAARTLLRWLAHTGDTATAAGYVAHVDRWFPDDAALHADLARATGGK